MTVTVPLMLSAFLFRSVPTSSTGAPDAYSTSKTASPVVAIARHDCCMMLLLAS